MFEFTDQLSCLGIRCRLVSLHSQEHKKPVLRLLVAGNLKKSGLKDNLVLFVVGDDEGMVEPTTDTFFPHLDLLFMQQLVPFVIFCLAHLLSLSSLLNLLVAVQERVGLEGADDGP